MYLINTEITVNWYLYTANDPPLLADLDIHIVEPDGVSQYIDNAILAPDYTPSTSTTRGVAVYRFTPDKLGLWTITLSEGTGSQNQKFTTYEIVVSTNDILTKKYVKGSLL